MKKLLAIISVLALTFALAACSAAVKSPFSRAGFLSSPSEKSVVAVSERCDYSVRYVPNQSSKINATYTLDEENSYLTTALSAYTSDGSVGKAGDRYYLFETHTYLKGEYDLGGTLAPAENDVTTKVYLTALGDGFTPVFSTRTVKADSLEDTAAGLAVKRYDFTVKTVYDKAAGSATVSLDADFDSGEANYSLLKNGETSATYTLSKINFTDYIDNEAILFAPRAMAISSSTSVSFNSIDALSKSLNQLRLAYSAVGKKEFYVPGQTDETEEEEKKGTYVCADDDIGYALYVKSVSTITLSLSVVSTYAGAPQTLTFADSNKANEYMRLIALSVPATYNTGTFEFTIKASQYKNN